MADQCKTLRGAEGTVRAPGEPKIVESEVLLDPRGELLIRHEGRIYRLQRTRLGKLILTA